MHLDERIAGDIAIIALKGQLLDDEDDFILRQKVSSLTIDGIRKIIIDLGKVNRINSRGLSALLATVKNVRQRGGDIRFADIDNRIHNIFVETRLVAVFQIYETVGRAMASYL